MITMNDNEFEDMDKYSEPKWLNSVSNTSLINTHQIRKNTVILLAELLEVDMDQFEALRYKNGNVKNSDLMINCQKEIDKMVEMYVLKQELDKHAATRAKYALKKSDELDVISSLKRQ